MRFVSCLLVCLLLFAVAATAETAKPADTEKPKLPELGRSVIIQTEKGAIKIGLYEKDAPITTKNFIELVERKFYDGLTFHRVIPNVLIQGGDPSGDGTGGSGKTIKLEVNPKLRHDTPGVVAMARRPDPAFDSATSQFYITMQPLPGLDMGYAVFGKVTEGMDVVKNIKIGDVMKTVRMAPVPEPKKALPKVKPAPKKTVKTTK